MNIVLFTKMFFGLFAIMNPIAAIPLFLSTTENQSSTEKLKVTFIASIAVFIILSIIAVSGKSILDFFGITLPAFMVAGGVIIFLIAYSMMHTKSSTDSSKKPYTNPALVPIAIPMLIGAGSISKVIVFSSKASALPEYIAIFSAIISASLSVFIILAISDNLAKLFGKVGMNTITKIMAILLTAIAAEMILEGIKNFFSPE